MDRNVSPDQDYQLWALLHQVDRAIYKARENEVRPMGISPMQAGIMYILDASDKPVPFNELARWLFREPHTVSELITRMEKQGLVKRIKSRGKKNTIGAVLTKKGQEVLRKQNEARRVLRRIVSTLSVEEIESLKSCLEKLREKALDELTVRPELPFT